MGLEKEKRWRRKRTGVFILGPLPTGLSSPAMDPPDSFASESWSCESFPCCRCAGRFHSFPSVAGGRASRSTAVAWCPQWAHPWWGFCIKAGNEVRRLGSLLLFSSFTDGQKSTDQTLGFCKNYGVKWWQYSTNCLLTEAPYRNLWEIKKQLIT